MQHGDGSEASTLRAQVRERWIDLQAGRRTRHEISRWAEDWLEDGSADEELVIQGLLFLQTVDLVAADQPGEVTPVHVDRADARFLVSASDISRALKSWQEELSRFDADPRGWMRGYMQGMLRDFAARYGVDRARSFADKLVASGDLLAKDAASALESESTGRSYNQIGSP